mmetsp:Transcript_15219/g.38578  ORF Transcript_15219/g.38578 Transcript_15219/m.38578 type:complete len:84 (-) Transcript_15219:27-278(-)
MMYYENKNHDFLLCLFPNEKGLRQLGGVFLKSKCAISILLRFAAMQKKAHAAFAAPAAHFHMNRETYILYAFYYYYHYYQYYC